MKIIILLFVAAFVMSCTSLQIKEVDPSLRLSHVCIKNNPKVIVKSFVPIVIEGFERHGITTQIYEGKKPAYCEFHLTYVALKNWDIGNYMHHAELYLNRGADTLAYAEYHLKGKGGLALNKWASVKSKMNPVIDKLLAGYTPEMVDAYRKPIPDDMESSSSLDHLKSNRLRELKAWFDDGLISEQEYNAEKLKVLEQ